MNSDMVWNCLAEPPLTLPGEVSNSSGSVNSCTWPMSETTAVNAIVAEPGVKEQFAKLGLQASPMKPDEFARFVREDTIVYKRIVAQAKIPQQ